MAARTSENGSVDTRGADVEPGLFARRLEELFRTVPGPNGRAYSARGHRPALDRPRVPAR